MMSTYKINTDKLGKMPEEGEPELHLLMVVSTDHISLDAKDQLSNTDPDDRDVAHDFYCDQYPYGWHLTITDQELEDGDKDEAEPSLRAVIDYAKSIGATHLRIDSDGPIIDRLPTYKDGPNVLVLPAIW